MYVDVQRKSGRTFTFYASVDAQWSRSHYLKAYRCHAKRFDELILASLRELLSDRTRLGPVLAAFGKTRSKTCR